MSSCPRRHASKTIRNLKHLRPLSPAAPEPFRFPHPRWFRLDSAHRYHTGYALGQGGRRPFRKREGSPETITTTPTCSSDVCRHYSSSRESHGLATTQSARILGQNEGQFNDLPVETSRTVLQSGAMFRKIVPSTVWIPKPEQIPRQEVLERRAHYIREVDPSVLLSILRSIPSSSQNPSKGIPCLALSQAALNELIPHITDVNTWRHSDGSGCIVKLRNGHAELYGSQRAREITQSFFSDIRRYERSHEHLTWHAEACHGSYLPVVCLPRPPVWTVRSLVDYITLITRPRSRRGAQRNFYGQDDSHHKTVFRLLHDLFHDPITVPFLSTIALRLALSYCRRHTESPKTASALWSAFISTGLQPDVTCFNQELGRCLVGKEFNRFCKTVLEMKHLGVQPDSTTWAVAMNYTGEDSSRAEILQLTKTLNSVGLDAQESLVIAAAKREIGSYIGTPNGLERFMEAMNEQFGTSWLTSHVFERLLRACRVGNAKMNLTSELLLVLKSSGKSAMIDKRCVIQLIHVSKKAGNLHDALELAKLEALSPIADIPQVIIGMLFSMAWNARYLNLCRYLWFLGAAAGRITWEMQRLVKKSLISNTSRLENSEEASWQLLAGKFIIGTNLDTEGFTQMFRNLAKTEIQSTPMEWLLNWIPDGDKRNEQIHLGQLLVERDLNAFRFFRRLRRTEYVKYLDEALALDEQWKADDAMKTISPQELIARSLQIPLKRREEILKLPGEHRPFTVVDHELDYNTLAYHDESGQCEAGMQDVSKTVFADSFIKQEAGRRTHEPQPSTHDLVYKPQSRDEDIPGSDEEGQSVAWQGIG